ncbi:selenocysteine-specific translation elongation factor [Melghirimyces algeriensis]|uniref:Selenocysteine-specific elongation factor n=1 Tax=Melghirimyces algeriensis TaxID=910412 RepID=A0A521BRH0_9BACL|nr:selenocysteine-specific translation elongation factor [Melghirimyces algeriensis]SMO49713.1 selenocysteine-specific translation elongation factor SelB [Melghirimyces algeriensis]
MVKKQIVLGTAGHIDHGKTMLTQALTGVNTDRLKEEKERNISIEPGYASLILPSGCNVSIVDVPGHERFIRQMVSGVAGIDFVLLIVAADDGVMPQTREHLSILQFLGIENGMIVLSKIDRADPELLPIIEDELKQTVKGTFLENTPVLKTSSITGEGITEVIQMLDQQLRYVKERENKAPFRLPIDRAFTVKGAGTVVTGTVQSGSVTAGDELEILPGGHRAKIRQAQVHGKAVSSVYAGQRAALNLTGVKHQDLFRGQTIIQPGTWSSVNRIDIRAVSLPDLGFSIRHRSRLKLLIGTAEVFADLILYDRKEWNPGEEIYATLILLRPVIALRGDRFILRRPTPATTIGGGEVVDSQAPRRKIHPMAAKDIQISFSAKLPDRILNALNQTSCLNVTTLARQLGENSEQIYQSLKPLEKEGEIISIGSAYISFDILSKIEKDITDWLISFHRNHPMHEGIPKAEWIARFLSTFSTQEINQLLQLWERRNLLRQNGDTIALASFTPAIPNQWKQPTEKLLNRLRREDLTPTEWSRLLLETGIPESIGADILGYLIRRETLYPLTDDLFLHRESFVAAVTKVKDWIEHKGALTMQHAKNLFGLSRKYLVPLLERMDQEEITKRQGNQRILIKEKKAPE